jgi:hypothetical protein
MFSCRHLSCCSFTRTADHFVFIDKQRPRSSHQDALFLNNCIFSFDNQTFIGKKTAFAFETKKRKRGIVV